MVHATVTLAVTHIASALCATIIACRCWYRYKQPRRSQQTLGKKLLGDDYLCAVALIPLIARWGIFHAPLELGTNALPSYVDADKLGWEELRKRELGSKLALVIRILYPTFIWMMKVCLTIYYSRLVVHLPPYKKAVLVIRIILGITYAAVISSLFIPCRPVEQIWQTVPRPDRDCYLFEPYLYTMSACNIFTDILLLTLPLPLVFRSIMPLARKIQFTALFSLGVFCMTISAVRIPLQASTYGSDEFQSTQTLYSSLEVLASCLVANGPAYHGILSNWKLKRFLTSEATRRTTTAGGSLATRTRNGTITGQGSATAMMKRGIHSITEEDEDDLEVDLELGYGRLDAIVSPNIATQSREVRVVVSDEAAVIGPPPAALAPISGSETGIPGTTLSSRVLL